MNNNRELDRTQQIALQNALNNDISIISGKSGTGKSYTALRIYEELVANGWDVSRVAPTGKAAVRIHGKTLHSWLEPDVEEDKYGNIKILGFKKMSFVPNEALIVDEASMINTELWEEVMIRYDASKYAKKIVFVGDIGQLPAIDGTHPYLDAIKSNQYPNVELDTIHRTKDGNDIVDLASMVRDGTNGKQKYKNVSIIRMKEAVEKVLENNDIQIISPMKKGINGTHNTNKVIQKLVGNDDKVLECIRWDDSVRQFTPNGINLHVGDKIIVTRNHFGLDLVNGTMGYITRKGYKNVLNEDYNIMEPVLGIYFNRDYDKKEMFIPFKFAQRNVELGYAITVHKYQGSEANEIIFVATPDQAFMLRDKKLRYTAITRAKEHLYIVN